MYTDIEKSFAGVDAMLYRKISRLIADHLRAQDPRILLVDGARQVGKTYIIRYVGKQLFENFIEVNMVEDSLGERLFAQTRSVEDFYLQLSMLHGDKMKEKQNTLVFLDEIQEYPQLLTLLKFLAQDGRFTYIASGSLLGVTLAQTTSIPMGSIRKVRMYPLDLEEFLLANGLNEMFSTRPLSEWHKALGDDIIRVLHPDFFAAPTYNGNVDVLAIIQALRDNSLLNASVKPQAPILLYHVPTDEQVPYVNATTALEAWPGSTLTNLEMPTHAVGGAEFFLRYMGLWELIGPLIK